MGQQRGWKNPRDVGPRRETSVDIEAMVREGHRLLGRQPTTTPAPKGQRP